MVFPVEHSRPNVRTYRKLRQNILQRLLLGPARPVEIVEALQLPQERIDLVSTTLYRLARQGLVRQTRIVLTGRWGGNVAVIYQLIR